MDWQSRLVFLPGIIIGLTIHEFSHALWAWILGDNTAQKQGRVTLNPFKHIDIIGLFFIIFAGFGWAKAVEFNPEKLRNFQRDRAIIAAAGPISNLLLGILLVYIYDGRISIPFDFNRDVLWSAAQINFVLFVFNMLPIPPLDGSHIVFSWLGFKPATETIFRVIGFLVLITYLVLLNFADITILPIGEIVFSITDTLFNFFSSG